LSDSSGSGLYLRVGEGLVSLAERPYDLEDDLQALIAAHPELLAGAQIDPEDPRRFILVRREAPVAGMELDHPFLDQDGIPTLVETKRSTNLQTRREVVAQMIDYAANAKAEWSAEKLRVWLDERLTNGRQVPGP